MIKLREMRSLDQRVSLFSDFLRDEFGYDGFVYGIALDTSSVESFLDSFYMKRVGRSDEWHAQYTAEDLGKKDLSVFHALKREGILQQSRVFEKVDQCEIPSFFREVPNRVRDYSKSGFFFRCEHVAYLSGWDCIPLQWSQANTTSSLRIGEKSLLNCAGNFTTWRVGRMIL